MPKRSNAFQRLVHLIEAALQSDGTSVRESVELIDRETGAKREVDIVITSRHGNHEIILSVECRGGDNPRPASVKWVEEMCCKHAALPTDKLVLVSRGGFTPEAKRKASVRGITALSLQEANDADWNALHTKWKRLRVVAWEFPEFQKAHLFLKPPEHGEPKTPELNLGKDEFCFPNCTRVPIGELYHQIIADPTNFISIEDQIPVGKEKQIEIEFNLPDGTTLTDRDGYIHFPFRVIYTAVCVRHESEHPLRRFFYGDASVAHGEMNRFSERFEIVLGSNQGSPDITRLALRLLPPPTPTKA